MARHSSNTRSLLLLSLLPLLLLSRLGVPFLAKSPLLLLLLLLLLLSSFSVSSEVGGEDNPAPNK
jgi:hypothetical protein